LALLFAKRLQVPVVMTDLDQARVDKGLGFVQGELDKQVEKGRLSQDKANRLAGLISGSTDSGMFADADFVIEAVFENLEVKQKVFADLEEIVSDTCVLATNTSSLSVTAMAEHLQHPERVVGFHFFNPVAAMPLLEIARAEHTDDATLATAFAVGKALKKTCVLVKDAPAFVVNRLLIRSMGEIFKALDEGTPADVIDHALDDLGMPMSQFELLGLVGPGVALHVSESMHDVFPDRYYVSDNIRRIVEAGRTTIDEDALSLLVQGDVPLTGEQVRDRVADALSDEIRRMLDEGVVAEVQDIDLCMIMGAAWPMWLGGISPYLDRSGSAERVTGTRFLPPGVASVPE